MVIQLLPPLTSGTQGTKTLKFKISLQGHIFIYIVFSQLFFGCRFLQQSLTNRTSDCFPLVDSYSLLIYGN